ncbi:MAG: Flp family type IVb pilin [Parahaliea sp.]
MKNQRSTSVMANKQRGQGMSEYIIITALIAVAAIGVFASFGDVIGNQTAAMAKEMAGQDGGSSVSAASENADTAESRGDVNDTLSTYHNQN